MFQFELKYWFTTICSGWATGDDIGSDDEALTKDYLSSKVWDDPANYIAIVRHQNGVVDATKVFQFKNSYAGTSLHTRFVQNSSTKSPILEKTAPNFVPTSGF